MAGRTKNRELIREIKEGNEEILLYLFKKYYKDLKRIFQSYNIKEKELASFASSVIVQIWMEIQQNDFSENIDLPSYLLNTAKETAEKAAEQRKARRKSKGKESVEEQTPQEIIAECVNVLDHSGRRALQLRYAEHKSIEEVSGRLNKELNTTHELLDKSFAQLSSIVKIRMGA